jgi:hypothetical protein
MSEFDFIIRNMRFSFSRINAFHQCKYSWYLQYIKEVQRSGGWFGEYGSFMHDILEKYLKNELSIFELVNYYKTNYNKNIVSLPPPFPRDMPQKYYEDGLAYLEQFEGFEGLEILGVESKIGFITPKGFEMGGFLDLLAKNKDGDIILIDHKSSDPFKGSHKPKDKSKIEEYKKQAYIYSTDIKNEYGKFPKEIHLNFFRINKIHVIPFNYEEYKEAIEWADNTIEEIIKESKWEGNIKEYFCKYLCSARSKCFKI